LVDKALRIAASKWLIQALSDYGERTGGRITYTWLAAESGISRPTLSKIKNRKTDPDAETLSAIHNVLGGQPPPVIGVLTPTVGGENAEPGWPRGVAEPRPAPYGKELELRAAELNGLGPDKALFSLSMELADYLENGKRLPVNYAMWMIDQAFRAGARSARASGESGGSADAK